MVRHLYVHLPFCASRCGYCGFVVEVGALDRRDAYLAALRAELAAERERLDVLETVYLGGGTPTLMRPHRIAVAAGGVAPLLADGAEVSIEANPETVDRAALRATRGRGHPRLDRRPVVPAGAARRPGPSRDAGTGPPGGGCAQDTGFASVSVDLLFGVPGQTAAQLARDIAEWLRPRGRSHLVVRARDQAGYGAGAHGCRLPDEDWAADAYEAIVAELERHGYRWYETANFARPGHECRHSLAYWEARDYLGIGVGAVSTIDGVRWRNRSGLGAYLGSWRRRSARPDPRAPRRRRRGGGSAGCSACASTGRWIPPGPGPPDHPDALARLADGGLLRGQRVAGRPHARGRFVQNAVLHQLMEYA